MILCNHGNGQDAFILVRTLFELMLSTEYIFINDTDEKLELFNQYKGYLVHHYFALLSPIAISVHYLAFLFLRNCKFVPVNPMR